MSKLAASCTNAGIALIQAGRLDQAIPYFVCARRFDVDGATEPNVAVLSGMLSQQIFKALDAGDQSIAGRLDDFNLIFNPTAVAQLSIDAARRRAAARQTGVEAALAAGDFDAALAEFLAANALDPGDPSLSERRERIFVGLSARLTGSRSDSPEHVLTLALLDLLKPDSASSLALARRLLDLDDLPLACRLCSAIDGTLNASDRFEGDQIRRRAELRLAGLDPATAEHQALEEARDGLMALGASGDLSNDDLALRVQHCMGPRGYRQAISDLRELSRRQPNVLWIAESLCAILRSVLHPEAAVAIDLIARGARDRPEDLGKALGLAWSIGAIDQALDLASKLSAHQAQYAIMRPLHSFATDPSVRPSVVFGKPLSGPTRIYAGMVCWGARYLALMEQAAIGSLLAPGNIQALTKKASVALELYVKPEDIDGLRRSVPLGRLAEHCEIRLYALPDLVTQHANALPYMVFGFCTHATILRAERDGADLMFLLPDVIYADGSLAALSEKLSSAPTAVFHDGLNAYAEPMLERLNPFTTDGVIAAPPKALLEAASHCLSRRSLDNIYRPGDRENSSVPSRVIFRTSGGLRLHGFVACPLYVSHAGFAPLRFMNFAPIDDVFSEHLLYKLQNSQIHMLSPDDGFAIVEVCEEDGATNPLFARGLRDSVLQYFEHFGLNWRRLRLFERSVDFPCEPETAIADETEIADRLEEIRAMFRNHPYFVDIGQEQETIEAREYPDKNPEPLS